MSTLTERQQAVLNGLNSGHTPLQIAEDLGVTRNAVYQQISKLKRMGLIDQAQEDAPALDVGASFTRFRADLQRQIDGLAARERALEQELEHVKGERKKAEALVRQVEKVADAAGS